jgi:hypothetical protein
MPNRIPVHCCPYPAWQVKKTVNAAFSDALLEIHLLNQSLSTGNAMAENYTVLYPILW